VTHTDEPPPRAPGTAHPTQGTGHYGPHNIGTHLEDVPRTLGTDMGGPDSPTSRIWNAGDRRKPPRSPQPLTRKPEVSLPMPPDNPGGPPPG
jgi:hypothetical protein